jgi:CheY-like chemotaxis protein
MRRGSRIDRQPGGRDEGVAPFHMNESAAIVTVLVIDAPVVTRGLRCWLKDAHVNAVLEAPDVTSSYRLFHRHHPDLVIIDLPIRGSVFGGLDVIRRMRAPDPRSCMCACPLITTIGHCSMQTWSTNVTAVRSVTLGEASRRARSQKRGPEAPVRRLRERELTQAGLMVPRHRILLRRRTSGRGTLVG